MSAKPFHDPCVEIYTTEHCPYCVQAKMLLQRKNIAYTEIRIDLDAQKREEMLIRAQGRRTVPQIFIHQRLVGGCDDLYALEEQKKLDDLLNAS